MLIAFAVLATLFALSALSGVRRNRKFRALATRLGFNYVGEAIPSSLPLAGTQLEKAEKASNLIQGERHGVRVLVFECRAGNSKYGWARTVIAAQGSLSEFPYSSVGLRVDSVADWFVMYSPLSRVAFFSSKNFMPLGELARRLSVPP